MMTVLPSARSWVASSNPIPDVPPVIKIVLFEIFIVASLILHGPLLPFSCFFVFNFLVYRIFYYGILSIVGWDASEKGSEKKCRHKEDRFGEAKRHCAGGTEVVYPVRISKDFHR